MGRKQLKSMGRERKPKEIRIRKYGYEYLLVEVEERPAPLKMPCFMDHYGYALKSFKKIESK